MIASGGEGATAVVVGGGTNATTACGGWGNAAVAVEGGRDDKTTIVFLAAINIFVSTVVDIVTRVGEG